MMLDEFGPVPDALDNDPRVYIMVYDMGGYGNGSFFAFDQYTQEQLDEFYGAGNSYSNEKEILYLNARDDVSSNLILSVAAHELEHMIHWNTDPDEESWIDEGCAELAMYHFGYPDPIVLFNLYPDNDLTMWDSGFADYVQTYLFIMYLYEKFGGTSTIRELLRQPENSIAGVNRTLESAGYTDMNFNHIFSNWVVANYLDNDSLDGGIYGYQNIDLPKFETSRSFSRYPIDLTDGTVSPWAADYIWMNNGEPQTFNFSGVDTVKFNVSVIKIDTNVNTAVDNIILNNAQDGTYELFEFGNLWDQIIFVVSNQDSSGPAQYSYSSSLVTEIDDNTYHPQQFTLNQNYPNPFNPETTIKYTLPAVLGDNPYTQSNGVRGSEQQSGGMRVSLVIYDILGREVATLVNGVQRPGTYSVKFDASSLFAGVYFYRLTAGNYIEAKKMTLLK
jgi:hypothetical protein